MKNSVEAPAPKAHDYDEPVPFGFSAHSRFLATQAPDTNREPPQDDPDSDPPLDDSFIEDTPVEPNLDADFVKRSLSSQAPVGFGPTAKVRFAQKLFGKTSSFSLFYKK